MIKVTLNDTAIELPDGATLADALAQGAVAAAGIATALNGTVVPSAARAATVLADGDTILVIKAFYGG